jgi:hypothetical protein
LRKTPAFLRIGILLNRGIAKLINRGIAKLINRGTDIPVCFCRQALMCSEATYGA